ncbi:MAG: GGDEF domain-containing protein [Gammaproteobacteria bacterium]|nr:GGDEF domain-containing protein [Gammaproteobacteria bacterium]
MTRFLIRSRQRLQALLPPELEGRELRALLTMGDHSLLLSSRRARLIINRVRLFAFLFAVLTPLWCVVDFLVFDAPLWYYLAGLRLLASGCFAVLLWHPPRDRMRDAYRVMAWLFTIPTLFYIASHSVLASYQLSDFSQAVATGYAFLPFVLMAGLAIFPLTLLESVLVAASVLGAQLLAGYFSWSTLNWPSFLGGTWLLVLLAGVVLLAGMSQLAFMLVLVRQVIHDPLTGAYARGSGEEIMQVHWRRALRQNEPLSLVFLDLDHFKAINDSHGHDAGDQVLNQFARMVRKAVREQDVLVRWGGEEFVLLLPMTSHAVADEILRRVQAGGFGERPDGRPLTASMGLAERCQDNCETLAALLELADQRMYQAKKAGRNRLCGKPGDC